MTWITSVPILVFLGLSVLELSPMYATDKQTDVRRASSLNAPTIGAGHSKVSNTTDKNKATDCQPLVTSVRPISFPAET